MFAVRAKRICAEPGLLVFSVKDKLVRLAAEVSTRRSAAACALSNGWNVLISDVASPDGYCDAAVGKLKLIFVELHLLPLSKAWMSSSTSCAALAGGATLTLRV